MPSPFNFAQRVTSKKVTEHPTPIPPVPEEQYRDDNNAYRGIENHGVASQNHTTAEDYWGLEGRPAIVYDEPEEEPNPIPVRIVSAGGRELRKWLAFRVLVPAGNTATQIVARDEKRTKVTIDNTVQVNAGDALLINHAPFNSTDYGFVVRANSKVDLTTEEGVWALPWGGGAITVTVLVEYAVGT